MMDLIMIFSSSLNGININRKEIEIFDGRIGSSYFWICPAKLITNTNTNGRNFAEEMKEVGISIEEDDVSQYLSPFLLKYFNEELEANKSRMWCYGFDWNDFNYFTKDAVISILDDIRDTISALLSGKQNEYTSVLKEKRGSETLGLVYKKGFTPEQIKAYNDNRPTTDDTEIPVIIDFFNRFIAGMEYLLKTGNKKGYDLIAFMGP